LNIKKGANANLSLLPDTPKGLLDPARSWRAIKCIKAKAAKIKGNTKCKAKNLFKVALLTEKPPQMTEFIENYLISLQNLSALFRLCFQPI